MLLSRELIFGKVGGPFLADDKRRELKVQSTSVQQCTAGFAQIFDQWRANATFKVLKGWRNEQYPVYAANKQLLFNVERSVSPLLGIVTYGVHMTAFVRTKGSDPTGMLFWIPRRSKNKQTFPSMLDNTVAGGISSGETPLETLVREAVEEASLPEELVRKRVRAAGTVTYVHVRDRRAGGETGLDQPECQYVYDLELDPEEHVIPRPNDDEVESFSLWSLAEVKKALARGEFKPNCAFVLIDFFVRHGILTAETEPDYHEIVTRLHRKLDYPMA